MDLLSINDLSKDQILKIFRIADSLKSKKQRKDYNFKKTLALLFEKPSTRTRTSFEAGAFMLGCNTIYLDANKLQVSRGETYEDTGKILGLYVDFIAARLFSQKDLVSIAEASDAIVINALTDLEHPCQALSDMYTIGEIRNIKGTRIAFMGDIGANTSNSLMLAATKLGAEISLVGPERSVNREVLRQARKQGKVSLTEDVKEGLSNADIAYTDTFVSMGQEKDAASRERLFSKYQLNSKALSYAKKSAKVMHCLPAHRGREIAADVLDGPRSIVFQQAKNKMFVEAALLLFLPEKELTSRR